MRDRLRLAFAFDADRLLADVERVEENGWVDHFVEQHYNGRWSVLPLRAPADAEHPIHTIYPDPACTRFADTPLLAQCSYVQEVLTRFECPIQAVRLMRLGPGSSIKPHTDHDLSAEYGRVRLHVPVVTNPDVDFLLNGERVQMGAGECWYLRLADPHSVVNRGSVDRVHLVIDLVVNDWVLEQLAIAEGAASQGDSGPGHEESDLASPKPQLQSDLEGFCRTVHGDLALQRQLSGVVDREAFFVRAIRLAAERGFQVTREEMDDAMRRTRRRVRGQPV